MKVKIISDLSGEMQFDMSAASFMQIIGAAAMYTKNHVENSENASAAYDEALKGVKGYVAKQQVVKLEKPVSKVERMFGDVHSRIPIESVSTPLKKSEEMYKGFLLIECEACGKLRGFYSKNPTSAYYCACGYDTPLKELRPAHLHCKCGSSFKYMTNVRKSSFSYSCLDCGAPIDLELNKSGTAFVTVGYNRF